MEISALSARLGLVAVVVATLAVHLIVLRALFRLGRRAPVARYLRDRLRWPSRTAAVLTAVLVALPLAELPEGVEPSARHGLVVAIIVTVAWLLDRLLRVLEDSAVERLDLGAKDNLAARRRLTRIRVIRRVGTAVIGVLAVAAVLLTFEQARSLGASLLASAGIAGLVAGVAARPTLGNLVAGLQVALTEPIRLDDVVVVEGEWGRVEEITLTYVVVQLWDRRRLVLPTSYFTENPFQNWTRREAQILGAVSLHLDHHTPVDALRRELHAVLEDSDHWDGDVVSLQVVDTTETAIEVRALASAEDAPTAWDLRCEIREALVAFLRREHPEALPVRRLEHTDRGRVLVPAGASVRGAGGQEPRAPGGDGRSGAVSLPDGPAGPQP